MNKSSFNGYLALCGTALLVAGCSGWSYDPPIRGNVLTEPMNVPAVREAAPQAPAGFAQALTTEYASLATDLAGPQSDWADADYFARKGMAAARGQVVPPENNSNWLVPLEVPDHFRTLLADSRTRLVSVLDGGARDRAPALAARAQARYDCWVERMEDDWKTAVDGPCYRDFVAAMDELTGKAVAQPPAAAQPAPPAALREYRVYFEFNKATLLTEARQILQQVADQTKSGNSQIMLVGKADRTGSDRYNLNLSQRRADAVRQALVSDGVPLNRIEERWVGEREPPVPTPEGVREPRNRVVEITIR